MFQKKGLLLVVSAPSGTGKGTLLNLLRKMNESVRFSVSATTRPPREGEVDGQDYFFKSVEEFKGMIDKGELLEWVLYCDNYYGTPRKFIEHTLNDGFDVVLEIEVEGAMNIKKLYPESVLVFVLPPSMDELSKRIQGRGTENADSIEKRILTARKEIGFIDKYDYIIVNYDAEKAARDINCIITAEKLRQKNNANILKELGLIPLL